MSKQDRRAKVLDDLCRKHAKTLLAGKQIHFSDRQAMLSLIRKTGSFLGLNDYVRQRYAELEAEDTAAQEAEDARLAEKMREYHLEKTQG